MDGLRTIIADVLRKHVFWRDYQDCQCGEDADAAEWADHAADIVIGALGLRVVWETTSRGSCYVTDWLKDG